jgi:hypothetical protein
MNSVNHFLIKFLSSELLPTLMQNIGIAFVTLLIPLVLFIFEKEYLFEWDKIVILDKVINAKYLIISFGLIFFPLFMWNYDSYILKFILFIFFLCGVSILINILFNSYHWIKTIEIESHHDSNNFRSSLRNKYLKEVTNLSEKEKVWSLTWRNNIPNLLDERNFIKKFIINIDALVSSYSLDMLSRYLQTFIEFVEKRSLYDFVIFNDLFPKILEWRFLFYQREKQERDSDEKKWFAIYNINENLIKLIKIFVFSAINKSHSFLFFRILKNYVQGKKDNFLKGLFAQSICSTFFDNIAEAKDKYDIWHHYFPQEWKITRETIEDQDNIISNIWLSEFFHWAPNRILSPKGNKDFDENLEEISKELFPSVEPILWSKILIFLFTPWGEGDRMKSLVEREPNFGLMGRGYTAWGSEDADIYKEIEKQNQATIELALLLFPGNFREEQLNKFIRDLKKLKYNDEAIEESRRKKYISIFEQIISLINQNKPQAIQKIDKASI